MEELQQQVIFDDKFCYSRIRHWVSYFLAYLAGYILGRRRRRVEENTGEAAVRRLLSIVFAGRLSPYE